MDDMCMNIGGAALKSGISAKMIRHYEEIGLIPAAQRTDSGYRRYTVDEVQALVFVKQARNLGFSTTQIADLLGLWRNQRRPSREVKALALAHIAELDERIGELEAMKRALMGFVVRCHGDHLPGCPILDGLAAPAPIARSATQSHPQDLAPMRTPFHDGRSNEMIQAAGPCGSHVHPIAPREVQARHFIPMGKGKA